MKLICGLLGGDDGLLRRARQRLTKCFGPVDLESEIMPFEFTDYYREEMGDGLKRWLIAFESLIYPEALYEAKHETNAIEAGIAEEAALLEIARPVNLDPGYVHPHKLVLASTKDASHRVAIGRDIYAEITLRRGGGTWQALPWTYADFASGLYFPYLDRVREKLLAQRRRYEADSERGE